MAFLNFTTGVKKVLAKQKQMTIRALRKRPFKVGDKLQLYTKLRTKNCTKLLDETCIYEKKLSWATITNLKTRRILAILDGFNGWYEMEDWFHKTHKTINPNYPLQIICWGEETKKTLKRILDKEGEENGSDKQ